MKKAGVLGVLGLRQQVPPVCLHYLAWALNSCGCESFVSKPVTAFILNRTQSDQR